MSLLQPRRVRVRWPSAYRIINSRYPPVSVFERIAPPERWETLNELEQWTNPRVREQRNELSITEASERLHGPGSNLVMAAFAHTGLASRFSTGEFGVYYAHRDFEAAVRDTAAGFARFLLATGERRGTVLHMRTLVSERVDESFHDLRNAHAHSLSLGAGEDWSSAQALGLQLRTRGSRGILFRSGAAAGDECLAVFRPKAIPIPTQGSHLYFHFDGARVDRWLKVGTTRWREL